MEDWNGSNARWQMDVIPHKIGCEVMVKARY